MLYYSTQNVFLLPLLPRINYSFAKNNIQICTKTEEESYFFGLGDDSINRRLNLLIGKVQEYNLYSNISDVMPFILSDNKYILF